MDQEVEVKASVGVDKTLEVIQDISGIVTASIAVAKSGVNLGSIPAFLKIAQHAVELLKDAKAALPELKDIDGNEAAKIGEASYKLIREIVAAVA